MSVARIVPFERKDRDEVLNTLSEAFSYDAIFQYIFNKERVESVEMRAFFKIILSAFAGENGIAVLKSGDRVAGAMVLCPPRQSESVLKALPALFSFLFNYGPAALYRLAKAGLASEKHFHELFGKDYYILQFIAINKDFQKRGYSKVLLDYLKKLASLSKGCKGVVLEARNHLSSYYNKFGYQLKRKVDFFGSNFNFMHLDV